MIVDALFYLRLIPLIFVGFISTRNKDWLGFMIAILYICVTTVNYAYSNPALNAVFSTPLVFITAWYIIDRNRKTL